MALYRKTTQERSPQEWVQKRKKVAASQLQRIPDLISSLFLEDDWNDFLRLVGRLPSYSYLNQLIIYDQFPSATVLAGFSVWQQRMASTDSDLKVLKSDAVGNGIDLVIPFTNVIGDGDYEMTWYSVLVFDVKQTNVQEIDLVKSAYTMDGLHIMFLRDAVSAVIGTLHLRRILFDTEHETLESSGAMGRISEQTVTVRRGASEEDILFWLTEALCHLTAETTSLSSRTQRFLAQCLQYCLYAVWALDHPRILPGSQGVVPESERALFLEVFQKTVFDLHQKIAGFYLALREKQFQPTDYDLPI